MRVLAFDFETVPCLDTAVRLWPGIFPDDLRATIGNPAFRPDPFAYKLVAERRAQETKDGSDFLKPFMHRIVAVGVAGVDLETGTMFADARASEDEAYLLQFWHRFLVSHPQRGRSTLVSWNGHGFDLPVARYRAMKLGVSIPLLYGPPGAKKWERYDNRFSEWHHDLMDLLAGFGRSTSLTLEEAAALVGLEAKTEGHGSKVLEMWLAGDVEEIRRYVDEDARTLMRVWLRWWAGRRPIGWLSLVTLDDYFRAPALVATP